MQSYFLFLRGINVGGHHKVPMAELKKLMEKLGFSKVQTLLNSGNVIFESDQHDVSALEKRLSEELEKKFGFSIPVLIKRPKELQEVMDADPFAGIEVKKDIRLYLSLIRDLPQEYPDLPWKADDGSFEMLLMKNNVLCSVLDVSKAKTPDAMKIVEQTFGKDITTRNVNTINKMLAKV
ncbi:DUF1697 domain-containing protein [Halocola ammonii]